MPRSKRCCANRSWHQLFPGCAQTLLGGRVEPRPAARRKGKIELSLLISLLPHQGENELSTMPRYEVFVSGPRLMALKEPEGNGSLPACPSRLGLTLKEEPELEFCFVNKSHSDIEAL